MLHSQGQPALTSATQTVSGAQPWGASARKDLWLVLPPFVVVALALTLHPQLAALEARYAWWTWLVLIVCIDVAHVYASIFRSYLLPQAWARQRRLFVAIPLMCLLTSVLLYQAGSAVFWSVLAYVAVFHFIRQQWGLLRLYARFEAKTRLGTAIDAAAIYSATLYPMLYWMVSADRQFVWFVDNEFVRLFSPAILPALTALYLAIMAVYLVWVAWQWMTGRIFNLPKNLIVLGTYVSWYVGIVYFNHPLIFTLLNVVSHGVPYMALVYFADISGKAREFTLLGKLCSWPGLAVYVAVLLSLAVLEETLWELAVWGEHLSAAFLLEAEWLWLAVPLLALPQLTHYVLDGFIWRRPKKP